MSKKRILIIGCGWEQEPLIDCVFEENEEVFCAHYNDNPYRKSDFKEVLITDFRNIDLMLRFAQEQKITHVISDQDDYGQFAQAYIADNLGLIGPKIEQAQIANNKFFQRERAKKFGLKIPKYEMVFSSKQAEIKAEEIGFPLIIKPVDNRGSFGVSKVKSINEVDKAFQNALANSHSRTVLIEEFIEGTEITIDGYCFNGQPKSLALAKKKKGSGDLQVSLDIKYPGEFAEDVFAKAMRNNEQVITALGYDFGMTHAEYIIDEKNDIYLVEAANRGGGCKTSELIVPNVCGLDLVQIYTNDCLGISQNLSNLNLESNEVILKFFTFKPGRISSLASVEHLKENESVLDLRILVDIDKDIKEVTSDADRHGYIVVRAKENVRKICDDLIQQIQPKYS